jgi:2-methylcitrate dehydratase PrpD
MMTTKTTDSYAWATIEAIANMKSREGIDPSQLGTLCVATARAAIELRQREPEAVMENADQSTLAWPVRRDDPAHD